MRLNERGLTLIECLVAFLVMTVIIGGTVTAFVTAADIVSKVDVFSYAEASGYARESIEKLRNSVANDSGTLDGLAMTGSWTRDDFFDPATVSLPGGAIRCYQVAHDCGGDCYKVQAMVCWNNEPSCPCS